MISRAVSTEHTVSGIDMFLYSNESWAVRGRVPKNKNRVILKNLLCIILIC
jgi:hypothetical protein